MEQCNRQIGRAATQSDTVLRVMLNNWFSPKGELKGLGNRDDPQERLLSAGQSDGGLARHSEKRRPAER
jgi:hypothetical protein